MKVARGDVLIEKVIKHRQFRKVLLATGRRTLGDVASMTHLECLEVDYLGMKALLYLREALAVHGLVFRQENPEEVLQNGMISYEGYYED